MKLNCALMTAVAVVTVAWPAAATITINSGAINTVDANATSYGAVRFKDFTNAKDGYVNTSTGNLYLQDSASKLGSAVGNDGRARVQSGGADGPLWRAGSQPFTFEYRPIAGNTDLILATVGYLTSGSLMTTPLSRVINDPLKPVNFISFYILNQTSGSGDITLNLTDLDGNTLTPSSFTLSASGQANWYLTDPALLANGFILSGSINLVDPRDMGETDKIDIAFGNATAVPEPSTYLAGAMCLLPFGLQAVRKLRSRKNA